MGLLIRGVAVVLAGAVLAGCYDPQLEDCTITCDQPGDCAGDQVCGDDGFCAAPDVAGTCAHGTVTSARLTIRIQHRGRVVIVDPPFTCEAIEGDAICSTLVPREALLELQAEKTHDDFDRWTTAACEGQSTQCQVLIGGDKVDIGARFH